MPLDYCAGSKATVELYREGKRKKVKVKIKSPEEISSSKTPILNRLNGAEFQVIRARGSRPGGILVSRVDRGSPAQESGLEENDIIISINREPINSIKKMARVIKEADGVLLVKLVRDERTLFIVIQ